MQAATSGALERHGASSELVVLLHGYARGPVRLGPARSIVRRLKPDADIFLPELALSTFSVTPMETIIADLVRAVDAFWNERERQPDGAGYTSVTLVGYSAGAILARALFLAASGRLEPKRPPRSWTGKVVRIVLLAGMNRGWTISSASSLPQRLVLSIGVGLGHAINLLTRRELAIFMVQRGAPFLTKVRLAWLDLERSVSAEKPLVVQLLGTVDDLVSPADNIDLATGFGFVYLEVPGSSHDNILAMDEREYSARRERRLARKRALAFAKALCHTSQKLARAAVRPADVDDLLQLATDDYDVEPIARQFCDVTDVLFVIHGIRDKGFWTKKVARYAKLEARRANRALRSVTSTYGYFAALPFVLPWTRRAKVDWLLDQYVAAKAFYPDAVFSFVGHSNGTYLLARALEVCPPLRFKRVVFAGSVVRRNYDWRHHIVQKRIRKVLNFVATADWVVAIFPKGLQTLRIQDLGSAGHDGFVDGPLGAVRDVKYVPGRHSAALAEEYWPTIARFVVHGDLPPATGPAGHRSPWVTFFGAVAPAFWALLIATGLVPIYAILAALGLPVPEYVASWRAWQCWTSVPAWLLALLLAGWLSLLRLVITRV